MYGGVFTSTLSVFFLTPVFIHRFGTSTFADITFLQNIVMVLGLFDLGLGFLVTRSASVLLACGSDPSSRCPEYSFDSIVDFSKLINLLAFILSLILLFSAFSAGVISFSFFFIGLCIAASVLVANILALPYGILIARGRIHSYGLLTILGSSVSLAIAYILLIFDRNVLAFAALPLVKSFLPLLLLVVFKSYLVPSFSLFSFAFPKLFSWPGLRSNAFAFGLRTLSEYLLPISIGFLIGARTLLSYTVSFKLFQFLLLAILPISSAILSSQSRHSVGRSSTPVGLLTSSFSLVFLFCFLLLSLIVAVVNPLFVSSWVGSSLLWSPLDNISASIYVFFASSISFFLGRLRAYGFYASLSFCELLNWLLRLLVYPSLWFAVGKTLKLFFFGESLAAFLAIVSTLLAAQLFPCSFIPSAPIPSPKTQ